MSTSTATPAMIPHRPATTGMGWRIAASILTVFGLAIFLLLFIAFWAGSFTGAQSAVVVVVAILVFVAMNAAAWASWGVRYAGEGPWGEPR